MGMCIKFYRGEYVEDYIYRRQEIEDVDRRQHMDNISILSLKYFIHRSLILLILEDLGGNCKYHTFVACSTEGFDKCLFI